MSPQEHATDVSTEDRATSSEVPRAGARARRPWSLRRLILRIFRSNPLVAVLTSSPPRVLVLAFVVGVSLNAWSWFLGAGWFSVTVALSTKTTEAPTFFEIGLGYIQQLNYGPWYGLICPFVYFIAAFIAEDTDRIARAPGAKTESFRILAKRPAGLAAGWLILLYFVVVDVGIELVNHDKVGLGWVQARNAQDWVQELEKDPDGMELPTDKFLVFEFTPRDDDSVAKRMQATRVVVRSVSPSDLTIRSRAELFVFVLLAKAWAGLWQALVVFCSLLALVWGAAVVRSLNADTVCSFTSTNGRRFKPERPLFYLMLLGILCNVFGIMRFIANAAKGSYGSWNQLQSLAAGLSPGLVALLVGTSIFYMAELETGDDHLALFSTRGMTSLGVWTGSTLFLLVLVLGHHNPMMQDMVGKLLHSLSFIPFLD